MNQMDQNKEVLPEETQIASPIEKNPKKITKFLINEGEIRKITSQDTENKEKWYTNKMKATMMVTRQLPRETCWSMLTNNLMF